jgi:hypothetical protein
MRATIARSGAALLLLLAIILVLQPLVPADAGAGGRRGRHGDGHGRARTERVWRRAHFPALREGEMGTNVLAVQLLLRSRDGRTPVDGRYGETTRAAVAAFQRERHLRVTGMTDADTWRALVRPLREGDESQAVKALQQLLRRKLHAPVHTTGIYGGGTEAAVARLQRRVGLRPDGAMDTRTWRVLAWHFERPAFGRDGLCDYSTVNGTEANWATSSVVAWLEAAGRRFLRHTGLRIAIGDLSHRFGGALPGHDLHARGLEADLRPVRDDGRQCTVGGNDYRAGSYDPARTRRLIRIVRRVAKRRIELIAFNDPRLTTAGLTIHALGHDDHIHVTWCEPRSPARFFRCGR